MPTRFAFRLMRPTVNWIQKAVGKEMRIKLCDLIDVPICCWGEDQSCGHFFCDFFQRSCFTSVRCCCVAFAGHGKIVPFSHRQLEWNVVDLDSDTNVMGFLKHILLGDIGQSIDIMDQQRAISTYAATQEKISRSNASTQLQQTRRIQELQQQCAQLHLAVTALTQFLIQRSLINESELRSFIDSVDASDGTIDGKLAFPEVDSKVKLHFPPPTP